MLFWYFSRICCGNPLQNLGNLTTPLGLMAMGPSFDLLKALTSFRAVFLTGAMKLVLLTTLCSAFTVTRWLYLLRSLGFI